MAIIPQSDKSPSTFVTPRQKKQRQMILVLAGLVGAIGAVLYFGFYKPSPPPAAAPSMSSLSSLATSSLVLSSLGEERISQILKTTEIKKAFLKHKQFSSLVLPGQFPLVIGEKGRPDPFVPFELSATE